ncbi:MAG: RdgB/HAM1 family non-canonical purine NTP pyrophosphatase [Flavobacteriaceae bacterium]|nr:RdgB/HAM1 family non-canonical purine NTP pyrophosphatase [Flavobacteriaceae bacterium]MDP4795119.1 RdgB/HAM1 family non-canonical purine NTP pyrophosphatase [Flavobacteriaceae bacterium]
MNHTQKLILATNNRNKVAELNHLLGDAFEILTLKDIGFDEEIQETGATLHENAQIKSSLIFDRYGLPTLSDDSGLFVAALDGAPGVFSARYAGPNASDQENIDLLLQSLKGKEHRSASFKTVLSFQINRTQHFFEGAVHGTILESPRGTFGFGYDPVFMPLGGERSFAEMDKEAKNQWSHRSIALSDFIQWFKNQHFKY